MTTYTFSEARQKLASVLDKAKQDGEVLVRRKDGSVFVIRPISLCGSPLNVEGIDLDLTAEEIVDIVREIRER
jgi:antitoxin (DNA-binding transcriptional repressor) of toxin-antitoxin stability system